jgi:hypothetical protein
MRGISTENRLPAETPVSSSGSAILQPAGVVLFAALAPLFLFLTFAALYLVTANREQEQAEFLIYALFFSVGPVVSAFVLHRLHKLLLRTDRIRLIRWGIGLAAVIVPVTLFAWGLIGIDIATYHRQPHELSRRFTFGLILGAIAVVALGGVLALEYFRGPAPRWLRRTSRLIACIAGPLVLLSLFDINLSADPLAYAPYVGPALLHLEGGRPLIDVFGQYGPNFMVFSVLLTFGPHSLSAMAAFVSAMNVLYYLVFTAIVVRLCQRKALAWAGAVFCTLFLQSAYFYNLTATPSVLGMRFLPPLVLVLALVYLREDRLFSIPSVLSFMLCSFWALEALLFATAIYGAYLVFRLALRGDGYRSYGRCSGVLLGVLLVPHAVFTGFSLCAWGMVPRYDVYLEMVRAYGTDRSQWLLPVDPDIRTWALFGTYALALVYVLWQVVRRQRSDQARVAGVGALAVFGIVTFSYYVGRSTTPVLAFQAFPLLGLAVIGLDGALSGIRRESGGGIVGVPVFIILGIAVPLMTGVIGDRFLRPLDPVWGGNSTVLRFCLGKETRSRGVWRELRRRVRNSEPFPADAPYQGEFYLQAEKAYQLMKKWEPSASRQLVFIPEAFLVGFHSRRPNGLGIAHAMVDDLSPTLRARIVARAANVRAGEYVYVAGKPSWISRIHVEDELLDSLKKTWRFTLVEHTPEVDVYRLDSRDPPEGPVF